VSAAPHGKTHCAPQLIRRQLDAGAWGMTAATVHQVGVMALGGAERVLLANELATAEEVRWLELLRRERGIEVLPFVDSVAAVELLAGVERSAPLPVLLELGDAGGRAGCRDADEACAVAAAIAASRSVVLTGLAAWEGGLPTGDQVDALLRRTADLARSFDGEGGFGGDEILLSAGGSLHFDRVAELLRAEGLSRPVRTVVRSGCYLTHDHGIYATGSPLRAELRPALQLWAQIRSCPEPGLAIAGFGRRDAPFDAGLPLVEETVGADGVRRAVSGIEVSVLNDQHAFLAHDGTLEVGDLVVCGVSHPCTAFDKWSVLPLEAEDSSVLGAVRTLF
jgi:D-serine deaminase-like pyridoxal phosphate-dependent protein